MSNVDLTFLRQENEDLQKTFDLMWEADMRAIRLWQEANPGNDLTWPDRAKLTGWLLERISEMQAALKPFAEFCEKAEAFVEARVKDGGSPIMTSKDFRLSDYRRARSVIEKLTAPTPSQVRNG